MSEICELTMNVEKNGIAPPAMESLLQWFAVYTTPRHEKHVSQLLAERRIETFCPTYCTERQWAKRRPVDLQLPLFPSYVFVRIARRLRGSVLALPAVLSIVGSSREPWPIPDVEIEMLRLSLNACKVEPHPYLNVGERVRVKTGVLTGVEGILIRKKNEFRVVLTLDTIMRSVAIEINAEDLEPADASPLHTAAHAF